MDIESLLSYSPQAARNVIYRFAEMVGRSGAGMFRFAGLEVPIHDHGGFRINTAACVTLWTIERKREKISPIWTGLSDNERGHLILAALVQGAYRHGRLDLYAAEVEEHLGKEVLEIIRPFSELEDDSATLQTMGRIAEAGRMSAIVQSANLLELIAYANRHPNLRNEVGGHVRGILPIWGEIDPEGAHAIAEDLK